MDVSALSFLAAKRALPMATYVLVQDVYVQTPKILLGERDVLCLRPLMFLFLLRSGFVAFPTALAAALGA